jgi:beta-glucosidase
MFMTQIAKALSLTLTFALFASVAAAQKPKRPWLNTSQSFKVRAQELVSAMTLKEKCSQLTNIARAIPRLGVPAYNWWSEALHGVLANGATNFPEPIGLGATFDPPLIHQMARAISFEARVIHEQSVRNGNSFIFHGLDYWAPNINIFRDPRWGRGQETYGEDPYLTGRMAVAYVTGMQGTNPRYYRVISTPKHFDAHSGPEPIRHFSDYDISRHDLEATYLPAFRAAIVHGHAGSIMCAYTATNGQPDCANQFLLQTTLRGDWQFHGYVVSDCDAVHDIFSGHHYRPTQPQASAISLERGMDNECYGFTSAPHGGDYRPYLQAVQEGYLSVHAIDRALVRLFTARMKLGMFDPASMVPYDHINPDQLNSPAHRALDLKLAEQSMVLLKNDGVLPLKSSIRRIAVVGPLADQTAVLFGNYSGVPKDPVTALAGIKAAFPNAQITYVPGTQFLNDHGFHPVPDDLLTTPSGRPGLEAHYAAAGAMIGFSRSRPTPLASRVEPTIDLTAASLPAAASSAHSLFVRWSGYLTPRRSGDYYLGVRGNTSFAGVSANGRRLAQEFRFDPGIAWIHLQAGRRVRLSFIAGFPPGASPRARLVWARISRHANPAALAAAKRADAVIAVVGIDSNLESEQSPVDQPGFFGGDRTNLKMPAPEEALVRSVARSGKPLVVVLMNGSTLAVRWEKRHAAAILEAWYPGEVGGAAIGKTLSGANDPGGRLPVTFYKSVHQLPPFEDYSMQGRTYQYFHGHPLWPFGYGLSYTTFRFSDLQLPTAPITAGDPLNVSVRVTNTGHVAGDEVAELYLQFPKVPGAPIRALRGVQRIHLAPGASQTLHFHLKRRDLSMVTAVGHIIVARGDYLLSVGGGQPGTGAPVVSGHFTIHGQLRLPD